MKINLFGGIGARIGSYLGNISFAVGQYTKEDRMAYLFDPERIRDLNAIMLDRYVVQGRIKPEIAPFFVVSRYGSNDEEMIFKYSSPEIDESKLDGFTGEDSEMRLSSFENYLDDVLMKSSWFGRFDSSEGLVVIPKTGSVILINHSRNRSNGDNNYVKSKYCKGNLVKVLDDAKIDSYSRVVLTHFRENDVLGFIKKHYELK